MANLKDLIVRGASRFIGKVYIDDSHITTINDVAVTDTPKFTDTTALGSMTGTLGVAHGGTGQTTAVNAANSLMNALGIGSSTPVDADYYISQFVGGGTTTTTYHRRPMSALWAYIKSKIDANGGYANKNVWGNVKVGSTTIAADAVQDTLELVAGSNVTITPDATNDKVTIAATDTTYTAASANPKMDGTVAVGTSAKYARQDHVHPTDTSRVPTSRKVAGHALTADVTISKSDVGLGNVDNTADSAKTVSKASTLTTARSIDGVDFNGSSGIIHYGDCTTVGNQATKEVQCDGFKRDFGSIIIVTFTYQNTVDPKDVLLKVSTTDAAHIKDSLGGYTYFAAMGDLYLEEGSTVMFVFDGQNYRMVGNFQGYANSLAYDANLEGINTTFANSPDISYYAICSTAATTTAKVASLSLGGGNTFSLGTGARVFVYFTNAISVAFATLNVNNTGAKNIYYHGAALGKDLIKAKSTHEFVYNGTQWDLVGDLDTHISYLTMTQTEADEGTATTGRLISPQVLRDTIEEYGGGGGGSEIITTLDPTIPYVQLDSTSTSTAFTATIDGITELKDGLTILVKNGRVTSASGVTFKLNNFDAKPIYYSTGATSRVTTHWNSAYTWLLTYDSTRAAGGCWLAYWGYDSNSNDTTTGYIRENHGTYKPTTALYSYMICLQKNETQVIPLNTTSNAPSNNNKTLTDQFFNPFGRIFYYSNSSTVSAGSNIGASYLWTAYSGINYGYSFNTHQTLTPNKDIYLKASLAQSDDLPMRTMAVLADDPIVQQLPLYEDEYIYIKLGHANTDSNGTLTYDHPIYVNRGGQIMLYQDHYNDWNTFKGYSRAERSWFQFSNYDNPGINGLFEVKTSEDTGLSGTPPYSGYYPMLSMQRGFVAMQFAGSSVSGDLYWRGRQSGDGDLANIAWRKVIDSGTGVTTGTITSSHTINYQHLVKDALGNVSMYLQITLTSAVSQWGQLATIPSGFHPVHTMRVLGLNGTTAIPVAINKSSQNSGSVQIGAAASSGAVIYITAHYNVN